MLHFQSSTESDVLIKDTVTVSNEDEKNSPAAKTNNQIVMETMVSVHPQQQLPQQSQQHQQQHQQLKQQSNLQLQQQQHSVDAIIRSSNNTPSQTIRQRC